MRISDWSSDVCSSDLAVALAVIALQLGERVFRIRQGHRVDGDRSLAALIHIGHGQAFQTVRSDSDPPPNSSLDWAAALVSAFALASMAFARRERASPYCCLFSRRRSETPYSLSSADSLTSADLIMPLSRLNSASGMPPELVDRKSTRLNSSH